MPTRVMAQQPAVNSNNVNGQAYDMQSRGREAARNDDSGSGGNKQSGSFHASPRSNAHCHYSRRAHAQEVSEKYV